jgi:hypothetical protein
MGVNTQQYTIGLLNVNQNFRGFGSKEQGGEIASLLG